MLYLVLFGPPGVGKGTQARRLADKYKIPHVSAGDMIRDNVQQQTAVGRRAEELINRGHFIPDALVTEMILDRLSEKDCQGGYILDGFPRTILQAKSFEISNAHKLTIINLTAPAKVLIRRILERAKISERTDDTEEILKERLSIFTDQTLPVIEYYHNLSYPQTTIDASGDLDSIFNACVDFIETVH